MLRINSSSIATISRWVSCVLDAAEAIFRSPEHDTDMLENWICPAMATGPAGLFRSSEPNALKIAQRLLDMRHGIGMFLFQVVMPDPMLPRGGEYQRPVHLARAQRNAGLLCDRARVEGPRLA